MVKTTSQDADLEGLLKVITPRCDGNLGHDVIAVESAIEHTVNDRTYYDLYSLPKFVEFLQENGFRQAYSYNFKNPSDSKINETFAVWVHDDLGILAETDTFYGKLNSINIHYELPLPKSKKLSVVEQAVENYLLGHCSYNPVDDNSKTLLVRRDGRNKLASHLVALRLYGLLMGAPPTNKPWQHLKKHFLHLYDYSETHGLNNSQFSKISQIMDDSTAKNLAALPEDVKRMIGMPV
ncbi:MAG: hypothetical protein HY438_01285 [DPANN group archaeon]|nr:hypothetical protein [DPANN group archaeon]